MSHPRDLIDWLADGHWHTGPDLARELGISRAAISARARRLKTIGVAIHSVVGRGYRLAEPMTLLDSAAIKTALSAEARARLADIRILREIDSTNNELDRCDDGATRACLAEYQSGGRGRASRRWVSPFGCNLHVSVVHRIVDVPGPLGIVALRVGVELARMLADLGVARVGLKWPNDVWIDSAKLAGILIDHRGEAGGEARLIVGVGMNVAMPRTRADGIDQAWTRLVDHVDQRPDRNELAARVLSSVVRALDGFQQYGAAGVVEAWQSFDCLTDAVVEVQSGERLTRGRACGINPDGSLQVCTDAGLQSVYSGDVSVRPAS